MFDSYRHMGGTMAIFSKKHSVKRSDEQPKVILDGSLETKPDGESPAKDSSATQAATEEAPSDGPPVAADPAAPQPVAEVPSATHELKPEALVTPPVEPVEHRFGIDDAIQLMRSLPTDSNMALVVRVVRVTLAAVHVSVEEIVEDANRKETQVKEEITALESRVVDLDRQLAIIRSEITAKQADLKETINVRERLHLADQYTGGKPPPTPTAATLPRTILNKPFQS